MYVPVQKRVEQLVLEGKNVFFTGNAGTGEGSHAAVLADLAKPRPDPVPISDARSRGGVHSFVQARRSF